MHKCVAFLGIKISNGVPKLRFGHDDVYWVNQLQMRNARLFMTFIMEAPHQSPFGLQANVLPFLGRRRAMYNLALFHRELHLSLARKI